MKLTGNEFELIKGFVEKNCGIHLEPGKEYLIETRLTDIAIEHECKSFFEFYQKALADTTGKLRNRIVDAMTTNETSRAEAFRVPVRDHPAREPLSRQFPRLECRQFDRRGSLHAGHAAGRESRQPAVGNLRLGHQHQGARARTDRALPARP